MCECESIPSDPERLQLWLAVTRSVDSGAEANAAWAFWSERLIHLCFARYLVRVGKLRP
ncbi:MAG: hypothetical protein IT337_11440 [Thermomicrobiales bacterium]|nr:hypothetical protein [Thermomicrobiales bacterium]